MNGLVDDFIDRKQGRATIFYLHPDLEPILKPTYGVILYQEQVMQIAQVLAPKTSPVNQPVSATAITTPPVEQAPANLPPVEGLPTKTSTTEKTTLPNSTPNKQITNPK